MLETIYLLIYIKSTSLNLDRIQLIIIKRNIYIKIFIYILALSSILFASADSANSATCKKCHPTIAAEFQSSMHKKSSIYEDKIHKAVWDKHPAKAKGDYKCAKCHTPNATTEKQQHEGITCISCHTIKSVENHATTNKNIYSKKDKTFYSAQKGRESEKVEYKKTTSWWGNKTTIGSIMNP
ncbi:multiheme c-type cytochrome [Sulfurimonas sp.]|uniref:multiheme c-type cytochrome n=1 Tax=Sulfurimonas sp. TaxID=2022749 RepID=UPI0025F54AEB|nr:multiheme c-type cytochrome [Sulfurimonas sp.]